MKRVLAMLCTLALILSLGILPASAATGDVMKLQYVSLRTQEGKEGIYFGATFALTQATIDAMGNNGCYGLAATTTPMADDAAWAAAMGKKVQYSSYKGGLSAGQATYVRSTSVVNIININNDSGVNTRNAATTIYVRPYVRLSNGTYKFGAAGEISMKQVAQMIDEIYGTLDDEQRKGLLGMYERFSASMKNWGLTNLKNDYASGGYNAEGESLILKYRREKVIANMTDQNNILWSIETADGQPVSYSRAPGSNGVDADAQGGVYTLYPGRVYRGIPYSHGSSSLYSFQQMGGEPDENGVYVFENFNGSYFNGGSTAGTGASGQYNMARLGNDCWDAVHWAWESIGADVTADRTAQMTPAYGLILLGEDILVEAMKDSAEKGFVAPDGTVMGDDIWTFIATKAANPDAYGYRSINNDLKATISFEGYYTPEVWGIEEGNYTLTAEINGSVDGTRLVRYATRSYNLAAKANVWADVEDLYVKSYDYQVLYKTYALAQPGDAMVCFRNTEGHAIMIVDMNVIYNDDGTINGDESTITLLEQAAGHEQRQSRDTWGDYSQADHSGHSSLVEDCKYCAGYTVVDGEEIWALDYGRQVRTFKTIAESDYLAVTCDALVNPSAKISTPRISDSTSGSSNVNNVFSGSLTANYRIDYITLDIYDANGNKVSTATCFGIQDGIYNPFALSRFATDWNGAYGSVLAGNPEIVQKTDGETTWLEARTLQPGEYTFTLTCHLGNGFERTFRTGLFAVNQGTNRLGQTALLITLPVD